MFYLANDRNNVKLVSGYGSRLLTVHHSTVLLINRLTQRSVIYLPCFVIQIAVEVHHAQHNINVTETCGYYVWVLHRVLTIGH
jgi:hypothetical protein